MRWDDEVVDLAGDILLAGVSVSKFDPCLDKAGPMDLRIYFGLEKETGFIGFPEFDICEVWNRFEFSF